MNSKIPMEEYLLKNGSLTYTNVGVSMLPLLRQGKDLFTIEKKGSAPLRVGDVVLYKRPANRYVLHRIVGIRPTDYVILGDNCMNREYGIKEEDILGVMTSFVRNGREYSVRDGRYRAYTFFVLHTSSLRIFIKKGILWIRRRL